MLPIVAPIFTAVDLADYARRLDEKEQATMAEGGLTNPEFLRFMQVIKRIELTCAKTPCPMH